MNLGFGRFRLLLTGIVNRLSTTNFMEYFAADSGKALHLMDVKQTRTYCLKKNLIPFSQSKAVDFFKKKPKGALEEKLISLCANVLFLTGGKKKGEQCITRFNVYNTGVLSISSESEQKSIYDLYHDISSKETGSSLYEKAMEKLPHDSDATKMLICGEEFGDGSGLCTGSDGNRANYDDSGESLSAVTIVNISTDKKTYSNSQGVFSMKANPNDELRFVKEDFTRIPKDVGEVKIVKKLSGDLEQDSRVVAKVDKGEQVKQAVGLPEPVGKMREKTGRSEKRSFTDICLKP
ncbi:hypothetical protein FQA39_LY18643 [Lamprigera yunnana]|nr:hypothetical protein FQA39_LY18643 [Lamprigera yunnana]